jgi:hypothetical protein
MPRKNVAPYLQQLCNTTFEGGRLVQDDEDTIMLYDVPMWPGSRSDALVQKFQNISIDIFQCTTSISGFVVLVTVESTSTALSSRWIIMFVLLCTLTSGWICWQCLNLTLENVHEINLFQLATHGQYSTCRPPSPPSFRNSSNL